MRANLRAGSFITPAEGVLTPATTTGVPIQHMQRRAGHDDMNTMDYVEEAEDLGRGTLGEPFGPLPFDGNRSPIRSPQNTKALETRALRVGVEGFEPPTTSTQSSCTTRLCDTPKV